MPIQNQLESIGDGLYCEWAYVVDLDAGVLEVYDSNYQRKNA